MIYDILQVYIRRTLRVPALNQAPVQDRPSREMVAAALGNLQRAGLSVEGALVRNLLECREAEFDFYYSEMLAVAKDLLGDSSTYEPMYPNFPDQVADASEAELYLNAALHYVGDAVGVRITPLYAKAPRGVFAPNPDRVIRLEHGHDGINELFASILASAQPYSDADKADLEVFAKVRGGDGVAALQPKEFPVKENLAFVTALVLNGRNGDVSALSGHYRTATDVLRLAAVLSGGEADLVSRVRFKSFTRPERRMLMTLFAGASNLVEDMDRRPEQFKRLGERLHPGEFSGTHPGVAEAFRVIRSGVKVNTYNKQVEALLRQASATGVVPEKLLELLSTRPGDFARRLDHVVRIANTEDGQLQVVKAFSRVAEKVSMKVLVQLGNAYMNRNLGNERLAVVRGGNTVTIADPLAPLASNKVPARILKAVGVGLRHQFSTRTPLGKVWVDPALKSYTVPLAVQGASADADTVGRFSRLPVAKDVSTLRFFIHWKDRDRQRIDLDLSALFLDENFRDRGYLSYQNLRHGGYALHSGDFTSAPNGAAEFADIDIDKAMAAGVRYVVMDVRNYTENSFEGIPECFAGYMGRTSPGSGEVFEPSTVANKVSLTAQSDTAMVYVFDLVNREAIWCDFTTSNLKVAVNSLSANTGLVGRVAKVAVTNRYLTLHDLFMLHANARGELIQKREDAEVIFGEGGTVGPHDLETILADYL